MSVRPNSSNASSTSLIPNTFFPICTMIKRPGSHHVNRDLGSNRSFSLSSFGGEGWGEEAHSERQEARLMTADARSRVYSASRPAAVKVTASSPLPSPPKEERGNHCTL